MAVNNEIGTIQDIPSIASLLEPHGILFHSDAAQALCAMDVSALARYADLVSLSGHKFYGPQGIGALYIRREVQEHIEPLIHGGGQQDGLRSGTVPVALTVGMGVAAEIVGSDEGARDRVRIACHRDRFVEALRSVKAFFWSSTAQLATVVTPGTPTFVFLVTTLRTYLRGFNLD